MYIKPVNVLLFFQLFHLLQPFILPINLDTNCVSLVSDIVFFCIFIIVKGFMYLGPSPLLKLGNDLSIC